MLELKNVSTRYGPVQVLWDISLKVEEGELVCLLGGNASGKSTTMFDRFPRLKERHGQLGGTLSGGEQKMLAIADRGYVLQTGRIVLDGTAQNLIDNPMMRKAYLEL